MDTLQRTPSIEVQLPWQTGGIVMRCRPFYFQRDGAPGRQFSNLFAAEIELDTAQALPCCGEPFTVTPVGVVTYPSSENAFQAAKALHEHHERFVRALSPSDSARAGQGRMRLKKKQVELLESLGGAPFRTETGAALLGEDARYPRRPRWEESKLSVMAIALEAKFAQHPELWGEHAATDGEWPRTFFIEHTLNDRQWGDDHDGTGTNFLGKLLTALLWEVQTGEVIEPLEPAFREWLRTPNRDVAAAFYDGIPSRAEAIAAREAARKKR